MITARSQIESKYAEKLKSWGNEWYHTLQTSGESVCMAEAWKTVIGEGQQAGKIHERCHINLKQVSSTVYDWRKRQYKKCGTGIAGNPHYQSVDVMKQGFIAAQNKHKKELQNLKMRIRDYKGAVVEFERSWEKLDEARAKRQLGDVIKKYEAKTKNANIHGLKAVEAVKVALATVYTGINDYQTSMRRQCSQADKEETTRMGVFKDAITTYLQKVDIEQNGSTEGYLNEVNAKVNLKKDLQDFSNTVGPAMNILLVLPDKNPTFHTFEKSERADRKAAKQRTKKLKKDMKKQKKLANATYGSAASTVTAPFDDEFDFDDFSDFDDTDDEFCDDDDSGIVHSTPVPSQGKPSYTPTAAEKLTEFRALTDYKNKSPDELSFQKGEILILLYQYSPTYNYYQCKLDPAKKGYAHSNMLVELD